MGQNGRVNSVSQWSSINDYYGEDGRNTEGGEVGVAVVVEGSEGGREEKTRSTVE